MSFNSPTKEPFFTNVIYIIIFGGLSLALSFISFEIPGIDGGKSDLREVPLLISIFYIKKPQHFFFILLLSITGVSSIEMIVTFIVSHSIGLIVIWLIYNKFILSFKSNIYISITWGINTLIYYAALLIPLSILTHYVYGIIFDTVYDNTYQHIFSSVKFEMFVSSIITALYLAQYRTRNALRDHKENLEHKVVERTEMLAGANKKLSEINLELKSQKKELLSALESLKNAQIRLVQSEKMASLGTLINGVAHEINNPLNFINGGIIIINEAEKEIHKLLPDELIEKCKKANSMIKEGLERSTNIVKSLMSFSGSSSKEFTKCDLNKVIDNTLLFLNQKISSEIKLILNYNLNQDVFILPEKIHQVILNLLENALFAVNSSKKIKELIISTFLKKNKAVIEIKNSGPKISDEILPQIFDPFFTTKDPGVGIGLGLSTCYNLIEEHNGKISVNNTDSGVTFVIEIPILKE